MNAVVAIPVDEAGEVFRHFGKCSRFKIYRIANNHVVGSQVEELGGETAHGEIALWLVQRDVVGVICGSIGPSAHGELYAAGIEVMAGVSGNADEIVSELLAGTLAPHSAPNCGAHGGEGHCGGSCHCCSCRH